MMKRMLALLMALLLLPCGAFAQSPAQRYEDAAALMIAGKYAAAADAFAALLAYCDAAQMEIYCRGLALLAEGDYARAERAFTQLAEYKDAPLQLLRCQAEKTMAEGEMLLGGGSLPELLAAEPVLLRAIDLFETADYLPQMQERAQACRTMLQPLQLRRYDRVRDAQYGYCVVERDELCGVVNAQGELIVACEWEDVEIFEKCFVVQDGGKFGVLTLDGGVMLPCGAVDVSRDSETDMPALTYAGPGENETHMQYFTPDGHALPRDMRWSHTFTPEVVVLYSVADYSQVLYHLPSGELRSMSEYREWYLFEDGYLTLDWEGNGYQYFSAAGEPRQIPEGAEPFHGLGVWVIRTADSFRLIDSRGEELFAADGRPFYESVSGLPDGYFAVGYIKDGEAMTCLMDARGGVLLERMAISQVIADRFVIFGGEGKRMVHDLETGVEFEYVWSSILYKGRGVLAGRADEGWQMLDCCGVPLSGEFYQTVGSFGESLAIVRQNDLYGLVNAAGEQVLPCEYKHLTQMEPFIKIGRDDQFGLLSPTGSLLCPMNYRSYQFSVFCDLYRVGSGDVLYNVRGEAVLHVQGNQDDGWSVDRTQGRVYLLEDGLLRIYDTEGQCVY